MSTSAKGRKSYADAAVEKYVAKAKPREEAKEEVKDTPITQKFANIQENPFHKIVMQSDATPAEKQKAVARELAFDETKTKEENATKLAAFEEFKEYLMAYRKEMSKEIIRLSDTEAFGELQKNFQDMNASLLEFDQAMTPLLEIINAVNRLNMASDGQVYEVYKEIKEDEAEEERIAKMREEQDAKVKAYEEEVRNLNADISVHSEDKSFFGWGGVKKDAQLEIARKQEKIRAIQDDVSKIRTEMESTVLNRESKFAEFAAEKAKLRELLDLTSEEHKGRQEALIKAALNFVNTTDTRSGEVLRHMTKIKDQIGNVDDVNSKMQKIFAVINEGVKDAEGVNRTLTQKFQVAAEGESQVDRIDREDKLKAVNEHVEITTSSKVDTLETLGELQEESLNIRSMRETNRQQIDSTRKMHSSGTAGVASRLSTVLTAVSAAALNEAKTTTQNTLKNMNKITTEISQQEAIKNATQLHVQNDQFAQAIEKLASFREVSDKATEITRAAIEENKTLQRDMEKTALELEKSIKQLKGVTAEVMQADDPNAKKIADEQDNRKPAASSEGKFAAFKL